MGDRDISVLEEFVLLLEPFYVSTKTLESDSSVISDIVSELVGLKKHVDDWRNDSRYTNTDVCATEMSLKLEDLLDDYLQCDFVVAAVILDRTLGDTWKVLNPNVQVQNRGLDYIKKELIEIDPQWDKTHQSQK
jgi:hypothetical protein